MERSRTDPNTFRVEGDVAWMDLYDIDGSKVGATQFDVGDLPLASSMKWYALKGERPYVATRSMGRTTLYLHRVLLGCKVGDHVIIDHRDGDVWNNRRSNLRHAPNGANSRNSIIFRNGRRRGVRKSKSGFWVAAITMQFATEEDALRMREAWENTRDEITGENALVDERKVEA